MSDVRDVVLLHGWGMNAAVWKDLAAELSPQYRVRACDLPGYGASPRCAPYTLDAVAEAVARAAPPRCHVVGWSLGGLIALSWARAVPEQTARLALIAATPSFARRAGWHHALDSAVLGGFARALAADRAGALRRFVSLQVRGDDSARAVARQLRAAVAARAVPDMAALAGGLDILLETDLRESLADIRQRALVLQGDRDSLVPPAAAAHLSRRLPGARLVMVDGAAHAPFLSQPQRVAAALREFFDG
jgi:pimeloyl-[acyl-carrier protein] methyl ester esterase